MLGEDVMTLAWPSIVERRLFLEVDLTTTQKVVYRSNTQWMCNVEIACYHK
jgi:hypothetical protein